MIDCWNKKDAKKDRKQLSPNEESDKFWKSIVTIAAERKNYCRYSILIIF